MSTHDIQAADIHAQLQRRGRDDAVDAARAQPRSVVAPLGGQVAAAIGADARRLARVVVEHVLQVLGQHLDHQARLREHQRLQPRLDRDARDAVALRARRGAQAEIGVDHRRVPQQHVLVARRARRTR